MAPDDTAPSRPTRRLPIVLDRDLFLRKLHRHLTGALEDVIGPDELAGLLSLVGQTLGEEIGATYKAAFDGSPMTRAQLADVLVDLKQRIGGDFHVVDDSASHIALEGAICPFGEEVQGRPMMCTMTSNLIGAIVAENLGYARVVVERSIAAGDEGCRVVVHLRPGDGAAPPVGREYFGDP
jgi:predicted ArsR family transcriptional regulator